MTSRNVSLTPHFNSFIDRNVSSGHFNNASEVVRAGLQILEQRLKEEAARISALREAARIGFDDLEAGRYIELGSAQAVDDRLDHLGKRARSQARIGPAA